MTQTWVADTEPNERFSLYTRGNVGEVFPNVITPLTGTLIGEAVRAAQVELFVELGVLRPHEVRGPSVGTGVFAGYLYSSASCMRLFGVRMPGMTATTGEEQVSGSVEALPPYRPAKGDRNVVASLAVLRYTIGLLRRPDLTPLDEARRDAQAWLDAMPDPATAPTAELLEWIRTTYPPRIGASMKRLLQFSMMAGAPRALLDRLVDRPGAPAGLANRIVGGTGDIDSAQLALRLWRLGRLVAGSVELTAAFDAGLDGIAERTAASPLRPALESFLADHGHRGNDEYELATPAWVMDPTPVYASIERLRHAPDARDPGAGAEGLRQDAEMALAEALRIAPRAAAPMVRRVAEVSRLGSVGRERAKDILVLENLGARLVLHELVRRAADHGAPDDVRLAFCVTIDELARFVEAPTELRAVIDERSARLQFLDERVPPPWFDGRIPDPATWPRRADARAPAPAPGTTVSGIAVNGGVASGPARVITDPADPRGLEPGEVLVCAITDPSWTPLFLGAAAVVCDTGAMQSHAAIVSRELGIPAVLSVTGITGVAEGTMLHVDGDTGEVRIGSGDSRAMAWLPEDFTHPTRLDLPTGHHLRPIRATDVDIDLPAVMGSQARLWSIYGEAWGWPPPTMTREQDLEDLARHEREIEAHQSFNYAVLDAGETKLLGCVYIDPPDGEPPGVGAVVSWWVVDDAVGSDLERALDEAVPAWLATDWPLEGARVGV